VSVELRHGAGPGTTGGGIHLGVRPEDVRLTDADQAPVLARVEAVERLGSQDHVHVSVEANGEVSRLTIATQGGADVRPDERVGLHFPPEKIHLFRAGDGRRLDPRAGLSARG
jgi:ABC-type sugar transport system ATPase subunit